MPLEAIANVVIGGLLTGLVYGLMALGLSVIYGVVRIVNFAHGEIMTLAMYAAVIAFALAGVDPLWMLLPVAFGFFGLGYGLQRALINPFIDRPEHSQFILLLALALVLVNLMLVAFGPDARNVQVDYALDSYLIGPLLIDKVRVICALVALLACALLFAIFRYTAFGKAIRACADNLLGAQIVGLNVKHLYGLTFGLGTACVGIASSTSQPSSHDCAIATPRAGGRRRAAPEYTGRIGPASPRSPPLATRCRARRRRALQC